MRRTAGMMPRTKSLAQLLYKMAYWGSLRREVTKIWLDKKGKCVKVNLH